MMFDRLMADFYPYSNKIPKLMMIDNIDRLPTDIAPLYAHALPLLTIFDRTSEGV